MKRCYFELSEIDWDGFEHSYETSDEFYTDEDAREDDGYGFGDESEDLPEHINLTLDLDDSIVIDENVDLPEEVVEMVEDEIMDMYGRIPEGPYLVRCVEVNQIKQ